MATTTKKTVYEVLSSIDVSQHIEVKDTGRVKLKYLSWAWAWSIVKKYYPQATFTIYEDASGKFYFNDGRTAWVKTGVTIEGIEHIEYLPVMDNRNNSITVDKLTSFDVNKAVQRSLTKACARHGLGLYIYAGEDLPDGESEKPAKNNFETTITDNAVKMVLGADSQAEVVNIGQSLRRLLPPAMLKAGTPICDCIINKMAKYGTKNN